MIDLASALITAVALLTVLGIGYHIWNRRSKSTADPEQRDKTQEEMRMESSKTRRHERIGFVGRARVQPPTTLLFFGSIVAMLAILGVGVYQVAKTGSPKEMAYAGQIEYAVTALLFIGAGVWFKAKLDRKAGELNITYEGETSNATETIPFDRSLVQPLFDDQGDRDALLIPVFKKRRILGLFWSPQLVADEARARDVDKNIPDDQVTFEVPLDASTTWEQEDGRINVRAKDSSPVTHPERLATFEFVPSDRKSDAEIQDIQDENEQLRQSLRHERRINGGLTEEIESYSEALENRRHESLAHLNESLEVFRQVAEATNHQGRDRDHHGADPLDQRPQRERRRARNGAASE